MPRLNGLEINSQSQYRMAMTSKVTTHTTLHLDNVGPDDTAEFTVAVGEKTSTSKLTVKGIKTFFSLVH